LPTSMKWLLNNYGYSTACGVENLEESVIQTVECRDSINLPNNVLIINDWGDGGVVFCIADDSADSEYKILITDAGDLQAYCVGEPLPKDIEKYPSFTKWVLSRLEFEKEESKY
ncbi:hypothetical protein, partial [Oleiphilus sp. HI0132]|uniref:hypothetical protein n=1 Tax=Oleiphilus sp. HI0132 TaxID=1822270 RepID=UPI000A9CDCA4